MTENNNEVVLMKAIGGRLREIRELLGHTLKVMQKMTGASLSYISDFERGNKFPSSKYLKELAIRFKVSIDYIFTGRGEMFIPEEEDKKQEMDFGRYGEDIDELLFYMKHVPNALFAVLHFFSDYKVEHEDFLKKYLDKHYKPDGGEPERD